MGWLTLLVVLGALVWGATRWWDWNTILPEGYLIETRNHLGVYRTWVLYGPDGLVTESRSNEIYGVQTEYRQMVRIARMHAKSHHVERVN